MSKLSRLARAAYTLLFLTLSYFSFAQKTISGKVVAETDRSPIPGVTVLIKGTTTGTATNADGNFVISARQGDVLIFTGIAITSREVAIGTDDFITVQLTQNAEAMNEVVVTALGVKKEVKKLGYAVQEVKGADLIKAREPNPINNLVGKVAGLTVGVSPELLGAPQILLRGSTITLFVVDGIPINSDTWNISPDDIESYTILKGPVAASLYGYRGQNGAIVITTRRGSKDKRGFSIEFNSSTMFDKGFIAIPKVQDEYGPGDHGKYAFVDGKGGGLNDTDYDIWGPKFEGQLITQYDSEIDPATGELIPKPWLARGKDNLERFIETGVQSTANLSLSTATDKYDLRFSMSHSYQKGIVPNTKLNITNFNINSGFNFSPKLRLEANINYNRQYTPNYPDVNYGPNSMIYNINIWGGADWDIDEMRNYWQEGKEGVQQIYAEYFRYNNPYFLVYEWLRGHYKNDIYGYASLTYKINRHLELMGRTQVTTYDLFRNEKFPYSAGTYGREERLGDYREDRRSLFENNTEIMLRFNKALGWGGLNLGAFVGGNLRSYQYSSNYTTTDYLNVPGVYNFSNTRNPLRAFNFNSDMRVLSGYYSFDLGIGRYANLNTTGRIDKISTLPAKNNSYFYPSVSLSTVVSDYVQLPTAISFLKFRTSYAESKGGGTAAYIGPASHPFGGNPLGYGAVYYSSYEGPTYALGQYYNTSQIFGATTAAYYTNTILDDNIQSENRSNIEAGMDLRFLGNRIGVDVAFFNYIDGPKIFSKQISEATGYTNYTVNALKTSRTGWEVSLSGSPIRNATGFNWDVVVNWSTFKEILKELPEGLQVYNRFFQKGDRLDKFYGSGFVRTPDGKLVNDGGGRPIVNPVPQFLGYTNPDWVWGFVNKFAYKGFQLTLQFDGRVGGVMENYIRKQTFRGGRHIETIQGAMGEARYQDYLGVKSWLGDGAMISNGVSPQFDPVTGAVLNYKDLQFADNTTKTYLQDYISRYYNTNEGNLMDKWYMKLREVTLTYNIPPKVLGNGFIRNANVSLVGRNLLYFVKDKKNKDVDIDQYAGSQSGSGLQTPTTRRFGININLVF
jgi:TonB-linked SusC/RagA family outer membrane protein